MNKTCKICNLPIHEANLHSIGNSNFHYLCWERLDTKIIETTKKELKKFKRKAIIKAIVISLILNFFLWWGVLELVKKIINSWR